jgi:hypothetical protein
MFPEQLFFALVKSVTVHAIWQATYRSTMVLHYHVFASIRFSTIAWQTYTSIVVQSAAMDL